MEVVTVWCLVGILFIVLLSVSDYGYPGDRSTLGDKLHETLNNIGSCCLF